MSARSAHHDDAEDGEEPPARGHITLVESELESARFGYRVSRLDLSIAPDADLAAAIGECDFDVVIVRAHADDISGPARLASIPGFRAITADALLYWEWRDDGAPIDVADSGVTARPTAGQAELERLVRDIFADYRNHYSANPLFDHDLALDGYCEWARTLVESGRASCTVIADGDGPVGFGVVDLAPAVAEVCLAGVIPRARGRGRYRSLIAELMHERRADGRAAMRISTQAHNTTVMRTWARLGWLPRETLVTTHLVREGLLAP
jgi:GNAT superfamily N-acetyltransferase